MSKVYQLQNLVFTSDASDTYIAVLDGRKMRSLSEFYKMLSEALQFPDYFGENLDALEELLFDIDWIPNQFVLLMIHHHQALLENDLLKKEEILQVFEEIDNPFFEVCLC